MRWVGLILAGGLSRRMGREKALIEIEGVPMAEHVRRALAAVVDDVWVSVREGQPSPVPQLRDVRDLGLGPLAGIASGLQALDAGDALLAVACDMPFVTRDLLRAITGALGDHDAAVPVLDGVAQVACAAWSARISDVAQKLVTSGTVAPKSLLAAVDTATIDGSDWRGELLSIETLEDLASVLSR